MKQYLQFALLSLATYSLVPPLMKVATKEIPTDVAVLVSNTVLVAAVFGLVLVTDTPITPYLAHPRAPYMYAAGAFVAVGITAYYRALTLGSVSAVTPIFGLFIATSSIIGVVFLDESLTARKVLGVTFAFLALYLIATD